MGAIAAVGLATLSPGGAADGEDLPTWTGQHKTNVGGAISANSCDFTGDGKQDVVVSDWLWKRASYGQVGAAFVLPNGSGSGQLDDPATGAIRIEGPQKELKVGFRLNCAGDVNGDGIDDIIIDEGQSSRAWVVFGSKDTDDISLEFLGDRGFAIDRGKDEVSLDKGYDIPVTGVGDLDGDGYDDVAIASQRANGAAGQITVVKGRDDIATIDTSDDSEVLMRLDGASGKQVTRVHRAGDVDGDGVDDLVVGAPDASTAHNSAKMTGSAWVVSGKNRGTIDVTDDKFDGFTIEGAVAGKQRLGIWSAAAGDVNGDGLDDVLIGAPGLGIEGGAAVVLGSKSHDTVYTDPKAANGHAVWTGTEPEAPATATPTASATAPASATTPAATDNSTGEATQTSAATSSPAASESSEAAQRSAASSSSAVPTSAEETASDASESDAATKDSAAKASAAKDAGTDDRGWWIRDSATGGGSNNMGFSVAAAPVTDDYAGALAVGIFTKAKTVAISGNALGDDPVVDVDAVDADKKVVLEGQNKLLGRALGVVSDFGTDTCPLMTVGSAGSDSNGDVQLHALPGAKASVCPTSPTSEPTDGESGGTETTDAPDPGNSSDPTTTPRPSGTDGPEPSGSTAPGGSPSATSTEGGSGNPPTTSPAGGGNDDGDDSGGSGDEPNGGGNDDGDDSGSNGDLPTTGATVLGSVLAGAVLIALGVLAVAKARRKQK